MIGFGEDCCETRNPSPDVLPKGSPVPEKRMSIPELGVKIYNILERTLSIQADTVIALNQHVEPLNNASNDVCNLYSCLSYILALAEANCNAALIVHNAIG